MVPDLAAGQQFPCCARRKWPRGGGAEQRDELAPFQLIELHSIPPARAGLQDIELAAISQRVSERLYNLLAIGEGGCSLQVRLRQARICSIFICRCFGTSSSRDSALRCWLPGPKTGLGHVFACPLGIS